MGCRETGLLFRSGQVGCDVLANATPLNTLVASAPIYALVGRRGRVPGRARTVGIPAHTLVSRTRNALKRRTRNALGHRIRNALGHRTLHLRVTPSDALASGIPLGALVGGIARLCLTVDTLPGGVPIGTLFGRIARLCWDGINIARLRGRGLGRRRSLDWLLRGGHHAAKTLAETCRHQEKLLPVDIHGRQ